VRDAVAANQDRYTLDTSAVIAYFADEPGGTEVERLLILARTRRVGLFVCFMTFMEVLYRLWQRHGEREGKIAYLRLKALPVTRLDESEGLLLRAARIKATHDLSVADAWIAATALATASRLVHKDPEFRPLAGIVPLLELPLKSRRDRTTRN
jgi:predicted nucleic acid-binding protein